MPYSESVSQRCRSELPVKHTIKRLPRWVISAAIGWCDREKFICPRAAAEWALGMTAPHSAQDDDRSLPGHNDWDECRLPGDADEALRELERCGLA